MRLAAALLTLLVVIPAPVAAGRTPQMPDDLTPMRVGAHGPPLLSGVAPSLSMEPVVELARLEPLVATADATAGALSRAAHLSLTLGLMSDDRPAEQATWLREAEAYARRAVEKAPDDLDARFMLGAALGLRAPHEPVKARTRMAAQVLEQSEAILAIDPDHAGGLHLRGQLAATAMRLNPVLRFLARTVMGADALAGASWELAEESFRRAIEAEPGHPAHRIELVLLLRGRGAEDEAREEARRILEMDRSDPLTVYYKRRAREELERLGG